MNDKQAGRAMAFPWPPVLYLGAMVVAAALEWTVPLWWFSSPLSDILLAIGCLFVLAFVALLAGALRALLRAKTTISPMHRSEHLVTGGVFSLTRNPIYLAAATLMVGIGLIGGLLWFILLAVVASLLVQKLAIQPEERHLALRFGKKYRDYTRKVRRWI